MPWTRRFRTAGTDFVFIDTAGIRRKGKTKLMAEKLSVVMARRHIRMANVVVLVMDATEGVLGLDATIAGYAHEGGRPVILCVNKWDLISDDKQFAFEESIRYHLKFLEYAPVLFLSAKTGIGRLQIIRPDQDSVRVGDASRDDWRTEPIRREAAFRRAENSVHYAGRSAAALICCFYRQGWAAALFARTVSGESAAEAVRLRGHPNRTEDSRATKRKERKPLK